MYTGDLLFKVSSRRRDQAVSSQSNTERRIYSSKQAIMDFLRRAGTVSHKAGQRITGKTEGGHAIPLIHCCLCPD